MTDQATSPSFRHSRGSVLIMALIMVTVLAALTLSFATRIVSNEGGMEVDMAATYAMELAESANDWNVQRIFRDFDLQNDAYKLNDGIMSPVSNATTKPNPMLDTLLRADNTAAPLNYDYIAGTGTFADRWGAENAWMTWGPGQIKLGAKILEANLPMRYTVVELKALARYPDALTGRYIERQTRRVVKYSLLAENKIYDFAYFANNYGWMYGSPIYIHGNMGSNGDLGFQGGPTVNGMLYAALNPDIGAAGIIKSGGGFTPPVSQTLPQYRAAPSGMVPGDPMIQPASPSFSEDLDNDGVLDVGEDVNANGIIDNSPYTLGYKGVPDIQTGKKPLDMPYLGNLEYFKVAANEHTRPPRADIGDAGGTGGYIKQLRAPGLDPTDGANYNYLVGGPGKDAVYGNNTDENGRIATWEPSGASMKVDTYAMTTKLDNTYQERNGNLALMGTAEQPIVIVGPVVITNDLVLRGTIKGQGTFFVGRNTHVVGDVTYADAPAWRDPSNANNTTNINNPNFGTVAANNQSKDLVGFAVKGSIVLGQYHRGTTWAGTQPTPYSADSWSTCRSTYFKSGFQNSTLQSYQVDPTDASLGYVTGNTSLGKPFFHGDYTLPVVASVNNSNSDGKLYGYRDLAVFDSGDPNADGNASLTVDDRKPLLYMDSVLPYEYIQKMSTAGVSATLDTRTFLGPGHAGNSVTNISVRRPSTLMGIFYTNHLFGGRVGNSTNGVKLYGTMVARDEGVVFNTKCQFVYDPRVSEKDPSSHIDIYVPEGTKFESLSWEEMTPGQ